MDRAKFQKMFDDVDEFLIATLCDDIELCEDINFPVYSKYFFPPQVYKKLENLKLWGVTFAFCGLRQESEKNLIAVLPTDFEKEYLDFPVKFFKVTNMSKFKELEHKHYLGTIMSLGIKREVLGDLTIEKNACYGIIKEDVFDILIENLKEVGKNPVKVEVISKDEIPPQKFQESISTVSSLRLDSIVSLIKNSSRGVAVDLIDSGDVSVNYKVLKEKSADIKEGDVITIKKWGKFIFEKTLGESKKGKTRVCIKKFI